VSRLQSVGVLPFCARLHRLREAGAGDAGCDGCDGDVLMKTSEVEPVAGMRRLDPKASTFGRTCAVLALDDSISEGETGDILYL
jgi:hypothetical protein